MLLQESVNGEFRTERFSRSGRSTDQRTLVGFVECVENLKTTLIFFFTKVDFYLSLDGVEKRKAVEGFKDGILERRNRQWLEGKQIWKIIDKFNSFQVLVIF